MPTDSETLRNQLLRTDEEFRELSATHEHLDQQLSQLSMKPYLSDSEQLSEITLKKRKLQLKDRMEDILRRNRGGSGRTVSAVASSPNA